VGIIAGQETMGDGTVRVRPGRRPPTWQEYSGDVALFALVGREALNRSPQITACHEELEHVIKQIRDLPGGKELAHQVELAAMGLWIDSVDLAATVAASAASKLDVEELYAAAVWSLPCDPNLVEAVPPQDQSKSRAAQARPVR